MNRSAVFPGLGKTLIVLAGALLAGPAWADAQPSPQGMPLPTDPQFLDLHAIVNLACLGVFVIVFAAMFYSIWRHRKSSDPRTGHFHASTAVEMVWTAIPFAILMLAAYPATRTIIEQDLADSQRPAEQRVAAVALDSGQAARENQQ